MVTTRKSQQRNTGGRSGVVINKIDDSNVGLDGWFDSARSPEAESKQSVPSPSKGRSPKPSRKKTAKTPKKVELNLRGAAKEDDKEEEKDSTSVKKYVSKLRRKGTTGMLSPSELSKVSTAAPTPGVTEEKETDAKSDSGSENALLTQENYEEINRQSSNASNLNVSSSEVDFPTDDMDGDDLGPPELPQDEENNTSGNVEDFHDNYDDDDEGPGYNMVHDPETPLTVREERVKKEMDKIREERKKQNKKSSFDSESEANDNDDDEDTKSTPMVKKNKKLKKKKNRNVVFSPKGIPIANRDYETVPIGALIESSPDDEGGIRRSRRAKYKPLEFWRGEKVQFGAHNEHGYIGKAFGDMPIVTGIQKALPTPYKKRKETTKKSGSKKNSRESIANGSSSVEEFNSKKLRRKYKFLDGEEAYLWDDTTEDTADQKVVAYASGMEGSNLPISKKRKKTEGRVTGKAAQAFNIANDENDDYVGYIMGNLILPPKGIKDSESVGPCAQTFTVCLSQPKAIEVAFGDPDQPDGELDDETAQRFLLGPGDMFRVPPGNSYRLENHSDVTDCLLTWTIIRPRSVPQGRS